MQDDALAVFRLPDVIVCFLFGSRMLREWRKRNVESTLQETVTRARMQESLKVDVVRNKEEEEEKVCGEENGVFSCASLSLSARRLKPDGISKYLRIGGRERCSSRRRCSSCAFSGSRDPTRESLVRTHGEGKNFSIETHTPHTESSHDNLCSLLSLSLSLC